MYSYLFIVNIEADRSVNIMLEGSIPANAKKHTPLVVPLGKR